MKTVSGTDVTTLNVVLNWDVALRESLADADR
jgi:hypothetical protein